MQHYLTATRIDVLHSPFVFSLYQQCIAKEHDLKAYQSLEKIREYLHSDQTEIQFEDYGASRNSRKVTIKNLAKQHLKPARIAQILHRLIAYQQYEQVLELGTSLGLSTCYLALYPEVKVTTIEGSKEVWQQAQQTFKMAGVSNQITSHCGTFDKALPQILLEKPCYDLIFIDGNHSYEATIRYVKQLRPYLSKNGLMVLDDIYWSKGMTQAWKELKPSFNVSIDLFFIGILSQRTEQAKEDFKLRVW